MPTIPTNKMERELRALYLRWLRGLSYDSTDVPSKIEAFHKQSQDLIERLGGQTASLGALADFPVPKRLDLSPHIGTIYSDMQQAAIQASIMAGMQSTDAARRMFNAGMDKSFNRLNRLARTETTNAYWKNAWDSVADLPALVMVWGSEDGPRTCEWCKERNGMVIEDSNLRDHPNGRCTPIPMLRSMVEYKGSVRADGEIYMDPAWQQAQKVNKRLSPEELAGKSMDELAQMEAEYGARARQSVADYEARTGTRQGFAGDETYAALRKDLELIWTQQNAIKKAAEQAKRMAKVGHHPKIDKLPRMEAPSSLDTAYAAGKANPNGRGWFNPKTNSMNPRAVPGSPEYDYAINCTRVAYATEMRMRGYNVTAGAAGEAANKSDAWITGNWIDRVTGKSRNLKKVRTEQQLLKEMEKEPEGSRFFVVSAWKNGGAHIWNAEIRNGRVVFHEGQAYRPNSGTDGLTREYLNEMEFEKWQGTAAQVRFMRVDDLEPTDAAVTRGWVEVDGKRAK